MKHPKQHEARLPPGEHINAEGRRYTMPNVLFYYGTHALGIDPLPPAWLTRRLGTASMSYTLDDLAHDLLTIEGPHVVKLEPGDTTRYTFIISVLVGMAKELAYSRASTSPIMLTRVHKINMSMPTVIMQPGESFRMQHLDTDDYTQRFFMWWADEFLTVYKRKWHEIRGSDQALDSEMRKKLPPIDAPR